jgi:hypothetical protein
LSDVLPTRNRREQLEFKEHCKEAWNNREHPYVVYTHTLTETREFSTGALNFQNLLWKVRTTLSQHGVNEEYCYIRRQIRHNSADRPILEPAFNIFYPWNNTSWTITPRI